MPPSPQADPVVVPALTSSVCAPRGVMLGVTDLQRLAACAAASRLRRACAAPLPPQRPGWPIRQGAGPPGGQLPGEFSG